jgi:hypothetical protein
MTADRASAYRRLMHILELFGSDLLPEEQDQIRTAADALLFCDCLETDREAREALRVASDLVVRRVICGCALATVADRFLVELVGCGPEWTDIVQAA